AAKMKQSSERSGRPRFAVSESLKQSTMIEEVDGASTERKCLRESCRSRQPFQQSRANATQTQFAGQHQARWSCTDDDDVFNHVLSPNRAPPAGFAPPRGKPQAPSHIARLIVRIGADTTAERLKNAPAPPISNTSPDRGVGATGPTLGRAAS